MNALVRSLGFCGWDYYSGSVAWSRILPVLQIIALPPSSLILKYLTVSMVIPPSLPHSRETACRYRRLPTHMLSPTTEEDSISKAPVYIRQLDIFNGGYYSKNQHFLSTRGLYQSPTVLVSNIINIDKGETIVNSSILTSISFQLCVFLNCDCFCLLVVEEGYDLWRVPSPLTLILPLSERQITVMGVAFLQRPNYVFYTMNVNNKQSNLMIYR